MCMQSLRGDRCVNMAKLLIFLVATVCGVNAFNYFGPDYQRTPLGDAIDKTSLKLLKEAYLSAGDKNVIASPLGVMLLLSLYNAGAGEQSREEINRMLGGNDYKQLLDTYSALSRKFSDTDPDFPTISNKVYVANKYSLDDNFANTARSYLSEVDTLDFTKPQAAADIINEWADKKTKGHIKSPVNPDIIHPLTAAALFNVIFFQGHWHVPFNASETKDKDFYVEKEKTVKKPTMHLFQSMFYTENTELGARMIEIPYKEAGFRMVVVLPNAVDGLPSVLEKAADTGLLTDVFKLRPSGRNVDFDMPKFEIKCQLDLNEILPKVGVSKIFDEPAPGIVKGDTVVASKAFQESFVKVDEEGATAGAFTGLILVVVSPLSKPPPAMEFKVDHPFLFLILYEDKIMFAGTYTH